MQQQEAPITYQVSGTRKSIRRFKGRLEGRGIGWKSAQNNLCLVIILDRNQEESLQRAKAGLRLTVLEKKQREVIIMNTQISNVPIFCTAECEQNGTIRDLQGTNCPGCGAPTTTTLLENDTPTVRKFTGFTDDSNATRLFLEEVQKLLAETDQDTLTSSQMIEAFSHYAGETVTPRAIGPILNSLRRRKYLKREGERKQDYRYRLIPLPSPLHGFLEDEERINLLLKKVQEIEFEVGGDSITGQQMTEAFSRVVGQPVNGKATGTILSTLVRRGLLGQTGLKSHRTYRRLVVQPSVEPTSPVAPAHSTTTSLIQGIEELKILAQPWTEEARGLEARLADIEQEASSIREHLQALQAENPEAQEASHTLAQIRESLSE